MMFICDLKVVRAFVQHLADELPEDEYDQNGFDVEGKISVCGCALNHMWSFVLTGNPYTGLEEELGVKYCHEDKSEDYFLYMFGFIKQIREAGEYLGLDCPAESCRFTAQDCANRIGNVIRDIEMDRLQNAAA